MNLRFIDWIWHVRGTLALAPGQSGDDALDRLDPLFRQTGTSHERIGDRLIFRKRDQAAQDKMSIFDSGALHIEPGATGAVLRYHLTSRALLFCFLAPLLFLAIAQLTIYLGKTEKPVAASLHGKALHSPKKPVAKPAPKKADVPMNPIDKALGAPAPEKPGKDGADGDDGPDKKASPTPAYVFAAIFATLYGVGRILEDRLVRALFKRNLSAPAVAAD